jgi:hypothetical protein
MGSNSIHLTLSIFISLSQSVSISRHRSDCGTKLVFVQSRIQNEFGARQYALMLVVFTYSLGSCPEEILQSHHWSAQGSKPRMSKARSFSPSAKHDTPRETSPPYSSCSHSHLIHSSLVIHSCTVNCSNFVGFFRF